MASKQSLKSVERTVQRIAAMTNANEETRCVVEHMIESIVKNRDRVIAYQKERIKKLEQPKTQIVEPSRISGALLNTIHAHGPITLDLIGSATKRIMGNIQQVVPDIKKED